MTESQRAFLEQARVGRLATCSADGFPHCVPVCFVLDGESLWIPLDEKPKSVPVHKLRRVRNLEENPRVCLVVDHYEEDWTRLRFVMLEARGALKELPLSVKDRLVRKYPQYGPMTLCWGIQLANLRSVSWSGT